MWSLRTCQSPPHGVELPAQALRSKVLKDVLFKTTAYFAPVRAALDIAPNCRPEAAGGDLWFKDRDMRRSEVLIANGILPVQSRINLKSKVVSDS